MIREVKILLAVMLSYFLLSLVAHRSLGAALFSSLHVGLISVLALVIFRFVKRRGVGNSKAIIYVFAPLLAVVILNNLIFGSPLLSTKQLFFLATFITATLLIFAFGRMVNLQKHREFDLAFFVKYIIVVAVAFLILSFVALILGNF